MLFSSAVFTLSLLLLGPLNLQGKIIRWQHVPRHNLEVSTRWLPLSKSKDSPPHTQTNFDRTSEEINQPTRSNYDPNHQRDKSPGLHAGTAKNNLVNSEDEGEHNKEKVILRKRHGYFKVMTLNFRGVVKNILLDYFFCSLLLQSSFVFLGVRDY